MSAGDVVVANAPFVTTLRSRPGTIRMGGSDTEAITVRVEMPEVWDVVRVETSPDESVATLKAAALAELYPRARFPEDFVIKLRGIEVTNENLSVAQVGALNGSIFLVTYRRRRPVR